MNEQITVNRADMFQSSPDPEAGCNVDGEYATYIPRKFQSSPDPEAGCNDLGTTARGRVNVVSILTRPGGRVQPSVSLKPCLTSFLCQRCFNPHPTRRPGATTACGS